MTLGDSSLRKSLQHVFREQMPPQNLREQILYRASQPSSWWARLRSVGQKPEIQFFADGTKIIYQDKSQAGLLVGPYMLLICLSGFTQ